MAKYFCISVGLRGCYMPDSAYILKADTRRELKSALAEEMQRCEESHYYFNSRDIARIAAAAWREAHKPRPTVYDYVIPYGSERTGGRPYGVFVSVSTRADYLAQEESN